MVICLERDADLHTAQLMPLPLTVSCFSKIQIGFTFLVPAHPGSPGKRAVKRVCVCVCGTASILCRAQYMYLSCVCPFVYPSMGLQQPTGCCNFAAVGPAIMRHRSVTAQCTAARLAHAGSATLSVYVGS